MQPGDNRGASAAGSTSGSTGVLWRQRPAAAVGALIAIGGCAFCFVTGENLPVGLLPVISASLHSSLSATGLLVTAYALVVVVASPTLTHMTARVPRRYLLAGLLGVFALATLGAAAAPGYWTLMAARVATALAQAVFWSIAPVVAAGLFPPENRGQAMGGVLASGPLAILLGVPAGTFIGQQAGWRVPFVVLAGLGLAGLVAVVALLPATKPGTGHAAAGSQPNARRYWMGGATMVLAVSASFTAYTYVSAFLTRVAGFPEGDVPAVLLLSGLGSLAGVVGTTFLVTRRARVGALGPICLLVVSLFGLYVFAKTGVAVALLEAVASFGLSSADLLLLTRVLVVAPRSTDIASAWYSTSFNVGIAAGPVLGGLTLSQLGLRSTPLVGGLLALGALGLVVSEKLTDRH